MRKIYQICKKFIVDFFLSLLLPTFCHSTPNTQVNNIGQLLIMATLQVLLHLFIEIGILFLIRKQVFSKIEIWLLSSSNRIILEEVVEINMSKRHYQFSMFGAIKCALNSFFEASIKMKVVDDDFSMTSVRLD